MQQHRQIGRLGRAADRRDGERAVTDAARQLDVVAETPIDPVAGAADGENGSGQHRRLEIGAYAVPPAFRDQAGLRQHHRFQHAVDEIAAILVVQPEIGRQHADARHGETPGQLRQQRVDGQRFLPGAGQEDAAQERALPATVAIRGKPVQQRRDGLLQGGDLGGKALQMAATHRIGLARQPFHMPGAHRGEDILETAVDFLGTLGGGARLGHGFEGQQETPGLVALLLFVAVEELAKTGDQVGLGQAEIGRDAALGDVVEQAQAVGDGLHHHALLFEIGKRQVGGADGQQRRVQRPQRAQAAQQLEDGAHLVGVDQRGLDIDGIGADPPCRVGDGNGHAELLVGAFENAGLAAARRAGDEEERHRIAPALALEAALGEKGCDGAAVGLQRRRFRRRIAQEAPPENHRHQRPEDQRRHRQREAQLGRDRREAQPLAAIRPQHPAGDSGDRQSEQPERERRRLHGCFSAGMRNSTRRLRARPSGVSLATIGSSSPRPSKTTRPGSSR